MTRNNVFSVIKTVIVYFFILFIAITVVFFAINLLIQPQINKNIAVASQIPKNYWTRYTEFLGNFFTFQSGKIYSQELNAANMSIAALYFSQFKWTIAFTLFVFFIGFIIGNLLGIWTGYKYNKTSDFIVNIIVGIIATIPLVILTIIALSSSAFASYPSQFIYDAKYTFISLLIPSIITAFGAISLFHGRSRKIVKEVISSDYYLFGKSLGNSQIKLFKQYIFKNLIIGELQVIIPFYTLLFSTSLIVERIFSIPGQSTFLSYAFSKGEINLIMFYFTFSFFALIIVRFINDLILNKLNPAQATERRIKIIKKKRGVYAR
ncbi:ABC transporter permease subunit [Metamycoplasma neophronis]|uniref:ABC transporter permease n=1 Tax=Metamycoplasma neophronis TaxID=872983 RepID=A0ABY2YZE7_9BACT|nr:ABC transporter permease [Metamycoplasma neophronis]TPR53398.1 ABC transporter permease [Metamycoplasma neophronis]